MVFKQTIIAFGLLLKAVLFSFAFIIFGGILAPLVLIESSYGDRFIMYFSFQRDEPILFIFFKRIRKIRSGVFLYSPVIGSLKKIAPYQDLRHRYPMLAWQML